MIPAPNRVILGDCIEVMRGWDADIITTVITDPPYHLTQVSRKGSPLGEKGFMGKTWDGGDVAFRKETWEAVLRVVKPGGILLAFGGTRTFHRLTCAIEDAGWEIRDCLMFLHGQGFPKSHDISRALDRKAGASRPVVKETVSGGYKRLMMHNKEQGFRPDDYYPEGNKFTSNEPITDMAKIWDGYGTALKPAFEPIILAMKPLDGTFVDNAIKHETSGLNIDGGRIGGRWPANLILNEEAAVMLDAKSGGLKSGEGCVRRQEGKFLEHGGLGHPGDVQTTYGDMGGASRFFFVAKASTAEKNLGLENMPAETVDDGRSKKIDNPYLRGETERFNVHPTTKPLTLMKYLCELTKMPTGGIVLDPFLGSGTTAVACEELGRSWLGIEMDPAYVEIARKRIAVEQAQVKLKL